MSDWYLIHGLAVVSIVLLSFGAGYFTCLMQSKKIRKFLKNTQSLKSWTSLGKFLTEIIESYA